MLMAGTHLPVLEIVQTVITSVLMAIVAGTRVLDTNDGNVLFAEIVALLNRIGCSGEIE